MSGLEIIEENNYFLILYKDENIYYFLDKKFKIEEYNKAIKILQNLQILLESGAKPIEGFWKKNELV